MINKLKHAMMYISALIYLSQICNYFSKIYSSDWQLGLQNKISMSIQKVSLSKMGHLNSAKEGLEATLPYIA